MEFAVAVLLEVSVSVITTVIYAAPPAIRITARVVGWHGEPKIACGQLVAVFLPFPAAPLTEFDWR